MRPSFVVSLLILSLFLAKVQGIRLGKVSLAVQQHKQHDEENTLLKRSNNDADQEENPCKHEQCTGNIKNRKLVTSSVSTTHSLPKNVKNGEQEVHPLVNGNTRNVKVKDEAEEVKVNTLHISKHQDLSEKHYSELVEIAEMDYSPARRKTPIHN